MPSFVSSTFLKFIDKEPLKSRLERNCPKEMSMVRTFRARNGSGCNYVTIGLRRIWYQEQERDAQGFEQDLRSAGYPA